MSSFRGIVDWRAGLLGVPVRTGSIAGLGERVKARTVERFELGWYAGPRFRTEAPYRWLPYKEAYSPQLVRSVLDQWTNIDGPVFDPFAGSGTTLQVAVERDMESVGVEALEYPRWAANLCLGARSADADRLRGFAEPTVRVGDPLGPDHADALSAAPAAAWAIAPEVRDALVCLRDGLPDRGADLEADLAHLALISLVDSVSLAVKDGTSLRRPRVNTLPAWAPTKALDAVDIRRMYRAAVDAMAVDLIKLPAPSTSATVINADARSLPQGDASMGAAVFSPPYPNRYDYSAIYQLELALGQFVHTDEDLRQVRRGLLRSHLEAPNPKDRQVSNPAVAEVLRSVAEASLRSPASAGRTLRMLIGYFQDMQLVFEELARVLRPGAPAACVVATQSYFGVAVPTDLLLTSLAEAAGFRLERLWVLRRKGIPVQQRMRGEVNLSGSRESVIFLRKLAS